MGSRRLVHPGLCIFASVRSAVTLHAAVCPFGKVRGPLPPLRLGREALLLGSRLVGASILGTMRRHKVAVALMSLALTLGCDSGSAPQGWPPESPSKFPVSGFEPSSSFSFNDWTHVYRNEEDARAAGSTVEKIQSGHGPVGMAYLIKEGNFELPFNLFAIEAPQGTYVESQFEVLYFDDRRTHVRAVEQEGDRVALIDGGGLSSAGMSMSMSYAFGHPGARVRCAGQVYELHADGWYRNGRLVHAFSAELPLGRQ